MNPAAPIIIIGTGMAGYYLAREYRKLDQSTSLILITADDGRSYSKPMLSTGYSKQKTADELSMADSEQMQEQLSAQILTMTSVSKIEPDFNRIVAQRTDGDCQLLEYSKLVLACGAEVIEPPIRGDGLDRVHTINDLMDYARFRRNGWPIGSGPVEAACKSVVKTRLCRSGMRWSRSGGQNILSLRTYVKSHRWDAMWRQYKRIERSRCTHNTT